MVTFLGDPSLTSKLLFQAGQGLGGIAGQFTPEARQRRRILGEQQRQAQAQQELASLRQLGPAGAAEFLGEEQLRSPLLGAIRNIISPGQPAQLETQEQRIGRQTGLQFAQPEAFRQTLGPVGPTQREQIFQWASPTASPF